MHFNEPQSNSWKITWCILTLGNACAIFSSHFMTPVPSRLDLTTWPSFQNKTKAHATIERSTISPVPVDVKAFTPFLARRERVGMPFVFRLYWMLQHTHTPFLLTFDGEKWISPRIRPRYPVRDTCVSPDQAAVLWDDERSWCVPLFSWHVTISEEVSNGWDSKCGAE